MKANKYFIFFFLPLILTILISFFSTNKFYYFSKSYLANNPEKGDIITLNMTPNKFEWLYIEHLGQKERDQIRIELGSYCSNNWCRFIKLFITDERFVYFDNKNIEYPGLKIRFYFKELKDLEKIIEFEKNYYHGYFKNHTKSCISNAYKHTFIFPTPTYLRSTCLLKNEISVTEEEISVVYRINPLIFIFLIYMSILFIFYNLNFLINEIRKKHS